MSDPSFDDDGFQTDDAFQADDDLDFPAPGGFNRPFEDTPAPPLPDPLGSSPQGYGQEAHAPAPPQPAPVERLPVVQGHPDPLSFTPQQSFNPVGDLMAGAQSALGEISVPRIGIHVFGERPDTLDAATRASQDRRLSRATTLVRMGGLPAAIEAYQHEPTPALVIVESSAPAAHMIHDLDQLAQVCDPGTKVVVIGAANDIMLYRELMRRGVSEYLVAPLNPLQLISAIGGLFNDPSAPFVGRSIAFVGARGGVGSSTVAHNTAFAISDRMASETVIVDLDLPFGTAGLDFNQDPLTGVADALTQPDRLDPVLMDRMMVRCSDKLSLFAAPASLDTDWDIGPEAFEEVVQKIRTTAPFMVLDLPHSWNAWMRTMLISADEVVVVATPDLASLRNAKNMIDLAKAARPNDAPPRLVLNQVGVPGRPEIPLKDFANAMGVAPTLVLPFDPKLFGQASNNGQMVNEVQAKSKAAEGFNYLAQILAKRDLPALPAPTAARPAPAKKASFLSSLFRKK
ncbi:MAG: AAA family ATPase [Caulobacteraceae bacterium]|nr:AAA family ATPase [Caulobacteraceae bacterium]